MEPIETKAWWQSKGIIGGFIGAACTIAALFGVTVDPATQAVIVDQAMAGTVAAVNLAGAALAIWGRLSASKRIG